MDNKKNLSVVGIFLVLFGVPLATNNFASGSTMGLAADFKTAMCALIAGYIIITFLWMASGAIGVKEGLNSAVLLQHVFGKKGYMIPSSLLSISLPFWETFETLYFGEIFAVWFPSHPHIAFAAGALLMYGITVFGTLKGVQSIKIVSTIMVPFAIILFVILIKASVEQSGGFGVLFNYEPKDEKGFMYATNFYVASWMTLPVFISDITCEFKSLKKFCIAFPIAELIKPAMFIIGIICSVGFAAFGAIEISVKLGGALMICTHIFALLCGGTTIGPNTLMYTTQISSLTKIPRNVLVITVPIIVMILAFVVEYKASLSVIEYWINLVGVIFAPALIITLCHYWIVLKGNLKNGKSLEEMPAYTKAQCIAMVCGFAIGLLLNYVIVTPLPAVITQLVLTGAIYLVLAKLCGEWNDKCLQQNA